MNCVNCGKAVPEDKARLTLQVFLCAPCSELVLDVRSRARGEVEGILARLDGVLRDRVIVGGIGVIDYVDRNDFLEEVLQLDAKARKEAWKNAPTTPSSKSTKPPAFPAGGKRSSSRPSAVD